jgi:hypothetical protein
VQPEQGFILLVAQGLVEFLVVLIAEFGFAPLPQSIGGVHLLGDGFAPFFLALVVIFGFFIGHEDREGDVVRIFLDDILNLPAAGIFLPLVIQVTDNPGALTFELFSFLIVGADFVNAEGSLAVAGPLPEGILTGLPGIYVDGIGHHKRRVKSHAELADQIAVFLLISGELPEECLGAALGNGTQVLRQFGVVHADAVVGDGQGRRITFLELQVDFRIEGQFLHGVVGEGQIFQLVQGIG